MIGNELDAALALVRRDRELVGFLKQWLTVDEVAFRPLPDAMLDALRTSADFVEQIPGEPPRILQLESPQDAGELTVYVGREDGRYYVLAPGAE